MQAQQKVNALLFDLGGVVVDIDWKKVFLAWSIHSPLSCTEIADRFQLDEAYRRHECGELSLSDYFSYLSEIMEYQGNEASFALAWNSIFVGLIDETVDTLNLINPKLPIFLLTNTNATHETQWRADYNSIISRFNEIFVSSTMGYRKPDRKAFEHSLDKMNVDANKVLFFDDTEENVEGAKAVGLQAVHVKQAADINRALVEYGVLSSVEEIT